jgi:hypothetical protein
VVYIPSGEVVKYFFSCRALSLTICEIFTAYKFLCSTSGLSDIFKAMDVE